MNYVFITSIFILISNMALADMKLQLPAKHPVCVNLADKILCRQQEAWEDDWVDIYENHCLSLTEKFIKNSNPSRSCEFVRRNSRIQYNLNIQNKI